MERYDRLYRLYEEYDVERLRAYQEFVDVFPPVDSRVGLDYWADARRELEGRKAEIREAFDDGAPDGATLAEVGAYATRDGAFTALDLLSAHGRGVNALVLDVDETLRSAGRTDNEIPRDTLHLLTELVESGVPLVVCTGQTLENVKGFTVQGLGNELVHSGDVSIVYEAGTGVFTPGQGRRTKQLLYEELAPAIREVFTRVRSRALSAAPESVRRDCHLQGNEFNVTLKPNYETGSDRARETIDVALVHLLDLLGAAVAAAVDDPAVDPDPDPDEARAWARATYAAADPEIAGVLDRQDARPALDADAVPDPAASLFERVDAAYYEADAAEIGSRELNKSVGVEAALDVLGVDDPFLLVMGDSKSDQRVMEWAAERDAGIAAAPAHASEGVLDHVREEDGLVYADGNAAEPLRIVYALNLLAG
jgi:hydroxymethylpyrimidine pyrophosphatase-like HAD family hydrolase